MQNQEGSWGWAYAQTGASSSGAWTIQTNNQNTFAEVALVRTYTDPGNQDFFAEIGITQVVSNGQTENFGEDYPRVLYRSNRSSFTFSIGVFSCFAEGRWLANFW